MQTEGAADSSSAPAVGQKRAQPLAQPAAEQPLKQLKLVQEHTEPPGLFLDSQAADAVTIQGASKQTQQGQCSAVPAGTLPAREHNVGSAPASEADELRSRLATAAGSLKQQDGEPARLRALAREQQSKVEVGSGAVLGLEVGTGVNGICILLLAGLRD